MICVNCGCEFDEEMFDRCPFCLYEYREKIIDKNNSIETNTDIDTNKKDVNFCMEIKDVETEEPRYMFKDESENIESELPLVVENKNDNSSNDDACEELEKEERRFSNVFIEDMEQLSIRAKNVLRRNKIITFEELKKYVMHHDISKLRGVGVSTLQEIEEILSKNIDNIVLCKEKCDMKGSEKNKLIENIHPEIENMDVEILCMLGISVRTTNKLKKYNINTLSELANSSQNKVEKIIRMDNVIKIKSIEKCLELSPKMLLEYVLNTNEKEENYQAFLLRANNYTLQEIALSKNVTREAIRQHEKKFSDKIFILSKLLMDGFIQKEGKISKQDIEDMFVCEDHKKIMVYWMEYSKLYESLDFAELYVYAEGSKNAVKDRLLECMAEIIGEGIDIFDNLEDIVEKLSDDGFEYLDICDVVRFIETKGYYVYGDYIAKNSMPYGKLGSIIVKSKFPNGININDDNELNILRKEINEKFGEVKIPKSNRSFSARLAEHMVLRDRGKYVPKECINIDMSTIGNIKDYIDDLPDKQIYYSQIYGEFEGKLQIMCGIDNYNFLHGVLKLYYPDEYNYSKDYLTKENSEYKEESWTQKVERYFMNKNTIVHKNDIKRELPGITDIVLFTAVSTSEKIFLWDYNYYTSTEILDYNNKDLEYLETEISSIMENNYGYCSDALLYDEIKKKYPYFIEKNNIKTLNNLYYVCARLLKDKFDFRRPHILQKGLLPEISTKNIIMYMMGNPEKLSYETYIGLFKKMKWQKVTSFFVFNDIAKNYVRLSDDIYIKKDNFEMDCTLLSKIENVIGEHMQCGKCSINNFDSWEELPEIKYEWTPFLLHSIIDKYSEVYKTIEPEITDRRYEKGVIVNKNSEINNYTDIIIDLLQQLNIKTISERELLSLMILQGLTNYIPKEVYNSEKIEYVNENFKLKII